MFLRMLFFVSYLVSALMVWVDVCILWVWMRNWVSMLLLFLMMVVGMLDGMLVVVRLVNGWLWWVSMVRLLLWVM